MKWDPGCQNPYFPFMIYTLNQNFSSALSKLAPGGEPGDLVVPDPE